MDSAQLPDLDGLDREALKALLIKHQEELLSLAASHENELRSLEAELESHRQTLSQQDEELRSSSDQIEHLKLVIEKLRRRVFGVKSEKVVIQLEQLELHLEELETSQAGCGT
jgi:transposase